MSKKIKILTPRIYEHSDFFHNAYDFARENSLNTNELCLELSHYLVDNFDEVWKIEKPRFYKKLADLEAKLAEKDVELNKWSTEYARAYVNRQNDLIAENVKLKQQLAEKEKQYNDFSIYEAKFRKTLGNWQNQVAIERLEKVKDYADVDYRNHCYIDAVKLDKFIDNQIEELKKEKK